MGLIVSTHTGDGSYDFQSVGSVTIGVLSNQTVNTDWPAEYNPLVEDVHGNPLTPPAPPIAPQLVDQGEQKFETLDTPPVSGGWSNLLGGRRKQMVSDPNAYLDQFEGKDLRASFRPPQADAEDIAKTEKFADTAGSLIPGINVLKDGGQLYTGRDVITNKEKTGSEQVLTGLSLGIGALAGVFYKLGKLSKADEVAEVASDTMRAADDVAKQTAKKTDKALEGADDAGEATRRADGFAEPTRVPAPDNYRGRYNAERHAQGKSRLPDDYDAHHRIPQEYMGHSEFDGFDFHAPSNIQGVKGSRANVNIHQHITNRWAEFRQQHPNATRSQIEDFANRIDLDFANHWFD